MTPLADLIAAARPIDGGFAVTVPGDWMQGRTAYGGLSSALALEAVLRLEPDLPPLRSAQVAFIGPLAGEVRVGATRLRRGRNAAFLQSDVSSDAGLGLRATFVFMAPLASAARLDAAPPVTLAPPAAGDQLYTGPEDFFTGNFELFDPRTAKGAAEWQRWARLRAREGLDTMVELMAIGDALPPAAFKLVEDRKVPLSSLDWMINFVSPRPRTRDGWWLLHAIADTVRDGYSSQRMTIHDADGGPVAEAMQGVAIFG